MHEIAKSAFYLLFFLPIMHTDTISNNTQTTNETTQKITVIIKDNSGKELGSFEAQDEKSFQELAAMHGIDIPLACGGGVCGVCLCKVEQGADAIQSDKITTPLIPLPNDEKGNPQEVLACVAGVKTEQFTNGTGTTIILQKSF